MPKTPLPKPRKAPSSEIFIHGEVAAWHVLMVSEDARVEVPRERAQYEERQRDGSAVYRRRVVCDHLELELEIVLREPVRGFDRLQFSVGEWEA